MGYRELFPAFEWSERLAVGGILSVGFVYYLLRSATQGLSVWDERFYAGAAYRMVNEGFWLIPRVPFREGFFLEKPPLVMWLQSVSITLLGERVLAVRLPSILATLGVALLTYLIGREVWSRVAGLAGMASLLASPALFWNSHSGITADTDAVLLLFGSAFVWWTWRGADRPELLPAAGIAAGLAVLTKGVAAGVFVIVVLPLVLPRLREYLRVETAVAVGATVLLALPWNLYAYIQYPDEYVTQMYLQQVVARATGRSFVTHGDTLLPWMNYPYFDGFSRYLRPFWITAALGGVAHIVANRSRSQPRYDPAQNKTLGIIWWTVAPLLTFSILGGNHIWYILPMVVPISLLSGRAVEFSVNQVNQLLQSRDMGFKLRFRIVALLGIVGLVGLLTVYPGPKQLPQWDGQTMFTKTRLLWELGSSLY